MINLTAIKAYEEANIAHLDRKHPDREWWESLDIRFQNDIAVRMAALKDYQRDLDVARLNQEAYGTNP